MYARYIAVLIIALTLTLTGCESIGPLLPSQIDTEADLRARNAENSGDFESAAMQYEALAKTSRGANRSRYYLYAARAYLKNDQVAQAIATFANVNKQQLSSSSQVDAAIVESQLYLANNQTDKALAAIDDYVLPELRIKQQKAILKTRIAIYEQNENWLEKANSHIVLADLLPTAEREQNQQALWQALMQLTPQALDLFNPGMPPAVDSGWFALAYIVKSYQSRPQALVVAIENWHRNYPNHPADPAIYRSGPLTGTALPQQLGHITVLLPETGPYADAAQAIKQGILAAHFATNSTTQIQFIPIHTNPITGISNVQQAYQQAIANKTDLVIGPLDKNSVQQLAESQELTIPVLALNRLPEGQAKHNLYQFGLAPEDDAASAASYALENGFNRAIIMAPYAEWGQRIANAFTKQWHKTDGVILSQADYNEEKNDFSDVITPLLGLSSSEQRYQLVKRTIGRSAEFEPRRRQDIDVLFLIARPLKARQLVPQLKFHRSGQLPILATAHAYNGYVNTQQNIDLNDVIINDILWVFPELAADDPVYSALTSNSTNSWHSLIRLYALGADAYRLTEHINRLSHSANESYSGATGMLSINEAGLIERDLHAARFQNGQIVPLTLPEQTAIQ